jgi:uncharacterized membrane protein YdbT with pleckstrin-like domain
VLYLAVNAGVDAVKHAGHADKESWLQSRNVVHLFKNIEERNMTRFLLIQVDM